ncbi:protein of unknown function [[Clostridium] ultunense Esp]|uniref:Uncharacterized protein n=1 Tax=[Clostridium] ultunense Esp TaxID=1288971 RepID=A0A1M4PK75_9FIRM|nr:protein of unknown function [[Clostridium] ultunense Esp]
MGLKILGYIIWELICYDDQGKSQGSRKYCFNQILGKER